MYRTESDCQIVQEKCDNVSKNDAFWCRWGIRRKYWTQKEINYDKSC